MPGAEAHDADDPAHRDADGRAGTDGGSRPARLQREVAEVGRLALEGAPLPEVLERTVEAAAEGLDVGYAKILLTAPDRERLEVTAGLGWREEHLAAASVPVGAGTLASRTVRAGQPMTVEEGLRAHPRVEALPAHREHGVESGVAVPIPAPDEDDGGPVGVLAVHDDERRSFSGVAVPYLESLAHVVAATVDREARRRRVAREARRRRRELSEAEERYRTVFRDTQDTIYVTDADGTIVEMNPAGRALFGYTADEIAEEIQASDLYRDPDDRDRFRREIEEHGSVEGFEVELETRDGDPLDCLLSATVRTDPDGEVVGYQGIIRDVTQEKRFEERLRRRALHDPLTELPNRTLLFDRAEHAMARAERNDEALAVLHVDLDRFKAVNDSLGHAAGDQVLAESARRLLASTRESDTVARVGGDEFVVLLEELEDEGKARQVAERIVAAFEDPFRVAGEDVHVRASLGVAYFDPAAGAGGPSEEAFDRVIQEADAAMYRAKERPGSGWAVFEEDDLADGSGLLQREKDLRRALREDELVLHYQPIVSLRTGRVAAVEPLVRWRHPEQGLLYPGDFLPLAEDTGLILEMGWWTLEASCARVAEWNRTIRRDDPLYLHPNFSATQFEDPELPAHVERVLEETGLEPRLLELEVTEHLVIRAPERTREMRDLGVGICVDDFGTGYSSLSYLKELTVDCLKIDMSFVQGLGCSREDEAIASTILTLGEALDLDVVAEGVEETDQLDWLRRQSCGWGQGFLFARPAPPDEIEDVLTEDLAG